LITDREFSATVSKALGLVKNAPLVVDIDDPLAAAGELIGELDYEALLAEGDPDYVLPGPQDEWDSLSLLYTSGTTGDPKGVVYHHRGAYLNALGNALMFGLTPRSVYLWTLPMFHCNGWTYPWAVTAVGGTHVCLRKVDPALIFPMIERHRVTHLCGAPIVLNLLVHAPDSVKRTLRAPCRGGDGRRGPAVGDHRRHGEDGVQRDAPLRAHRELRAGDALRLAIRLGWPRPAGPARS
jgi:fatty-acyl-CoA synthase